MIGFVARRLGQSILVLFAMSLLVFAAVYAIGDPIALLISPSAPQAVIDQAVHNLGLDQPFYVQYLRFLAAAIRGDLGSPTSSAGRPC